MLNLDKINRLAVLLCGDFRCWSKAAEYIFKYADSQANTVDYYFSTWSDTSDYWYTDDTGAKTRRPVTEQDVNREFVKHEKKLVDYRLTAFTPYQHTNITYYYQSHLAKLAGIMKRQYELDNDFVYDQVIELRPDLYIVADAIVNNLSDFECLIYVENPGTVEFPGATDLYYQSSSFGNDVMSNRFYYKKAIELSLIKKDHWPKPMHNHQILTDYLFFRRMKINDTYRPYKQIVIRPNFPDGNLDDCSVAELVEFDKKFKETVRRN